MCVCLCVTLYIILEYFLRAKALRLDDIWLRITVMVSALHQFTMWIKQTSHV